MTENENEGEELKTTLEAVIAKAADDHSARIAEAIEEVFTSSDVSNGNPASIADILESLSDSTRSIADAITPPACIPGEDANGGHVSTLTEAVMGVSAGLAAIARAIERFAEVMESKQ